MQRDEIKKRIPHREPFLWVDEVIEMGPRHIHARKALPADLEVFSGHFPGRPIFPGVRQCEAAFQAAAILMSQMGEASDGVIPVVTRQNNTKFRNLVRAGETIDIEVELVETLANAFFFNGKVSAGGKVTVRLEFACALVAADSE